MLLIKAILFENSKHLGFLVSDGSLAKAVEQILQACEEIGRKEIFWVLVLVIVSSLFLYSCLLQ